MLKSRKTEEVHNSELERLKKGIKMLNSGTDTLNHILALGKASNSHVGLRYVGECSKLNFDIEKIEVKVFSAPGQSAGHIWKREPQ